MAPARKPAAVKTLVTRLEMRRPPRSLPPMPVNFHLALLKSSNMPLHFYRYLMDRVGREWTWVNALRRGDEDLKSVVHSQNRDIRVLYLEGNPAGFFEIAIDLPDLCEIAYFGLMDHATGIGLGRWFLGAAIDTAWSHGPKTIAVETCTLDHPAALPLYQKLGFEPVGQSSELLRPLTDAQRAKILIR